VDLVARLAAAVVTLAERRARVLVGVDGPDAAGKTTLADLLADALDVPTVRVGVDGFHRPRADRYRRGELSAEGYLRDSFDDALLVEGCLRPFHAGARRVRTAGFDHRTDTERRAYAGVPARAVLVVDGVFLLRPPLREWWTLAVYLAVSPGESLCRALRRDTDLFGSPEEVRRRYGGRYLPAQALYRREVDPERLAHVVVDYERPRAPVPLRWAPPDGAR
jgi:uridine kinase